VPGSRPGRRQRRKKGGNAGPVVKIGGDGGAAADLGNRKGVGEAPVPILLLSAREADWPLF